MRRHVRRCSTLRERGPGPKRVTVRERLAEAIRRGEVHADVDPDRLIEVIGGATLLRLLLRPDEPLDDAWVDQTTAIVVHGVTRDPVRAGGTAT